MVQQRAVGRVLEQENDSLYIVISSREMKCCVAIIIPSTVDIHGVCPSWLG